MPRETESRDAIKASEMNDLADALLVLRTREECLRFLDDLLTHGEMQSLAQRLQVAHLLRRRVTYLEIAERTGASTATVSRVNRALTYGPGGYQTVLERLEAKSTND